MRDFNFFRSYQKNKKGNTLAIKRHGMIAVGVVFLLAVVSGFNYFRMAQIKNNIQEMQTFMNNEANKRQYEIYLKENEKLALLNLYYDGVSKINTSIESRNHINTNTIDTLLSTMPEEIMLQTMTLDEKNMAFQGVAKSYTAIAEFEYNLRVSGLFSDVFVSNIAKSSDALQSHTSDLYLFAVTCKVKGGEK